MKLTTFFIPRIKQIYAKTLNVSESKFEIQAKSACTLFEILRTSADISNQRLFHENEIVQYLQNYKYQYVNQGHFKKPLQCSTNAMKNR